MSFFKEKNQKTLSLFKQIKTDGCLPKIITKIIKIIMN